MKIIIFDVDGVIIKAKDHFGNYLWSQNLKNDLGIDPKQIDQIYSENWRNVLKGLIDTRQYFKNAFAKYHIKISVDAFIAYWIRHDTNYNAEIFPILKALNKYKLYIGTNQEKYRTTFFREIFEPFFETVFSSCEIGAVKREAEFYSYIETKLQTKPDNIIFIDDSKAHIDAAEKHGWICHLYQNIESLDKFLKINSL